MRLGVFGGTFNPIHFGHLRAAEEVRDVCGIEKILFLPSGVPPLKDTDLSDAAHRYAMTAAATASNRYFAVSDLELRQSAKSYTVNTLRTIRTLYDGDEISLILGMDAFLEIPLWWMPEILIGMVDFIVMSRPGHTVSDILKSPYVKRNASEAGTAAEKTPAPPTEPEDTMPGGPVNLTSGRKATVIPVTPLDISSTMVRRLVRSGRSITYLVPPEVEAYILSRGLYRD